MSTLLDVLDREIARSRRAVTAYSRPGPAAYAQGRLCGLRHARLMALYGPEWAAKAAQGRDLGQLPSRGPAALLEAPSA